MRRTNSLKLIPDNPKFYDGFSSVSIDSGFMTLDEKIKKDPLNREKFRCESKLSSGNEAPRRRRSGGSIPDPTINQYPPSMTASNGMPPQTPGQFPQQNIGAPFVDSGGPKEFIKNLTPYEIILDFHPNSEGLSKGQRPPKPKTIKYFIGKWEVQDYLDSPVLVSLYRTGKIMDITEAQVKHEREIIRQREQAEQDELEARTMRAQQARGANPHIGQELRRLGSAGVEILIPDGNVGMGMGGEQAYQASTGDGGVFNFDVGGSGIGTVDPRTEVSEHESLVNSITQLPID